MNYGAITNATMTTLRMPTIEGMKQLMDEFEKKWPRSERAVAVELPPSTEDLLLHACGQMFPVKHDAATPRVFQSLLGLPLENNMSVPYQGYAIRMADGSKVMHYADGRSVRCLPETASPR